MNKTEQILRTEVNGLIVSTIKINKEYETLVLDQFGNELKELHTKYKIDAKHNHQNCVAQFINKRNCIHAI